MRPSSWNQSEPPFPPVGDVLGARLVLRFIFYALFLVTLLLLLIPLQDGGGMQTANRLSGYPSFVAAQLYGLVKAAILWVVPGMLLSLLMSRPSIQMWAVVVAMGGFLAGWITLPAMGWQEAREVLFALQGLTAGIWIGERAGRPDPKGVQNTRPPDASLDPTGHSDFHKHSALQEKPVSKQGDQLQGGHLVARVISLVSVGVVLVSLIGFPEWRIALALSLIAYAGVLVYRPWAWLILVPTVLPLLDLAPWSGRFFWDEFDLLMLVTLAVALWQGQFRIAAWKVPKLGGLLGLFGLVWLVSLLLGLFPLQPLDANAFSAYWSHYNSLRLGKGLLWGLVFYGLYRSQPERADAFARLSIGMALGVLGVSLWALWEQALFAGTVTTADYRVTAGFSSMHTGGGHIEAYMVIALPFVWGLFFQLRHPVYRMLLGAVFLLGAYAVFSTVARGGLIALGVALVILMLGTWLARRKQSRHRAGLAAPFAMGLLTLVVMAVGVSDVFWKQRLEQTGADAEIRFHHWAEVLTLRDSGVITALFGQGLGSLPESNLVSQLPDKAGSYRFASEGGNTYLALNSAGTLYMAQRVTPHPEETLRLEISVRAPSSQTGLEASLCEKVLFNSRQCQWLNVAFKPGVQEWQRHTQTFNSGVVGAGNVFTRRPVQFSLYNSVPGTVVEIDNVRLLDAQGHDLLKNGDFSEGGDFWFFKSGDHLFWHAKNLWVHLLFEQGWLGVVAFTLILVLALVRLARTVMAGEPASTVLLASIGAWIIVGGVDSLVDAPRIALLVYATLFIGAAWGARPRAHDKPRRRRHRHTHYTDDPVEPSVPQG